jgi:ankyrin repeat protein
LTLIIVIIIIIIIIINNLKTKTMKNNILELTRYDDIKGVKKMIAEGADINIQNKEGWTALMVASHFGLNTILELLLKAGADKDIKNNSGETALDYAKEEGNQEMVELLTNLKPIKVKVKVIAPTSKVIQISTNPNINDCEFIALCEDGSIWSYSTAIRDENERWTSILNNSTN